jgi:hypothetical protein
MIFVACWCLIPCQLTTISLDESQIFTQKLSHYSIFLHILQCGNSLDGSFVCNMNRLATVCHFFRENSVTRLVAAQACGNSASLEFYFLFEKFFKKNAPVWQVHFSA